MPEKTDWKMSAITSQVYLWPILMLLFPTSFADEPTQPLKGCSIIGFPAVSTDAQADELEKIPYLDFFIGPSTHSKSEVMACESAKQKLLQALAAHKIEPEILLEDMTTMQRSRDVFGDIPLGTMNWNDYHGLENIYTWLDAVVQKYPKLISMEIIGKTYENREIRAYKIEKTGGSPKRRATYLECLIHAREWSISLACPYIINELTEHSNKYDRILKEIRFYIVPVVNPDGFVYTNGTEKYQHLWRKNRRPIPGNEGITCNQAESYENIGVDLNRNWPFQWKDDEKNPCLHSYPGVEGVVEAEIKAVTEFILKHNDIDTFIDIHCYSQYIMIPWGYTKDPTPDHEKLMLLAKAAADAAEKVAGTKFEHGPVSILIKPSNGGSMDWAYGKAKKTFSFAVEMRPTRAVAISGGYTYPFRVPTDQILPVAKEAWSAVQVLSTKRTLDYANLLNTGAQSKYSATFVLSAISATLYHIARCCRG